MKAKEQISESQKFAGMKNVTQFGVSHSHDHAQEEKKKSEDDEHNNGVMFSCGSLAPKLKRGGGCMDHGFTRPKELWEMSDGSVFLLMELSAFPEH